VGKNGVARAWEGTGVITLRAIDIRRIAIKGEVAAELRD